MRLARSASWQMAGESSPKSHSSASCLTFPASRAAPDRGDEAGSVRRWSVATFSSTWCSVWVQLHSAHDQPMAKRPKLACPAWRCVRCRRLPNSARVWPSAA